MAKLDDVASLAGVSKSVASRALNNDPSARINGETRERVRRAAALLKYTPDQRSRALRTSRTSALGLVIPDVNNAVFKELLLGIQGVAAERNVSVLLSQTELLRGRGCCLEDLVGTGRVDGVIFQRPEFMSDDLLLETISGDIPVVLFNSILDAHPGSVVLDDHAAARIATEHLIGLGHRDIAFVGGTRLHDAAQRRQDSFLKALSEHDLPQLHNWVVNAGWEAEAGRQAMAELLRQPKLPSAIVVASVNAALGLVAEALRQGVRVPGQMSIVGILDSWMAQVLQPELSVVQMPLREAGAQAATMLLKCLEGEPLEDRVVTAPAPMLIERGTTGPPG